MRIMKRFRSLDRIDRQILEALQNDGRLSNKELASHVGLAPSSCLSRVRRLREDGILQELHAEVAPEALGIGLQAMVSVRLQTHSRSEHKSLREFLIAQPEVVAIYHLAGSEDFLLHVAMRDVTHLRDWNIDRLSARPEVSYIETFLIFEAIRRNTWPSYLDEEPET